MFLPRNQKLPPFRWRLQTPHRYQRSRRGGRGSALQIEGGSVIISDRKTNPQQVVIRDYSASLCVDSILLALMLDDHSAGVENLPLLLPLPSIFKKKKRKICVVS